MLHNQTDLKEPLNPSESVTVNVAGSESALATTTPSRTGLFSRVCVPNAKLICGAFAGVGALLSPMIVTAATDCMSALSLRKEDNHCDSPVGNVAAIIFGIELIVGMGAAFAYTRSGNRR